MNSGDNVVNEVIGVYDCLAKAQHALVENLKIDLQHTSYDNFWSDCGINFNKNCFLEHSNIFFDDKDFSFNFSSVRMWNGEDDQCCEDYLNYHIEERQVI